MNTNWKKGLYAVVFTALGFGMTACNQGGKKGSDSDENRIGREHNVGEVKGEEDAILTSPPEVPPAIKRDHPTKVNVELEVIETVMEIADGVEYDFWTFGGTVPGSFIRVREGDYVNFTLKNHPDNKLPHNIDLHAVNGQGGGAEATFVAPGYQATFGFTAMNPGLYVYHCATAPVGMHIANGMYGLILVEPAEGLPEVDKEYYVMQGDFYTEGKYGEQGMQSFDMNKALKEIPDYVLFNGKVGALTGDDVLTAEVGDNVRLYVGNGGPNLVSSFHVIGEIFDNVYVEGGRNINNDVQTTLVPAGGAVITEFRVDVPSDYILVDHSIFRTFNKGALGILAVEGEEDKRIYSGKREAEVYLPEGGTVQTMPKDNGGKDFPPMSKDEKIDMGKNIYKANCLACHQSDGRGVPNAFPPIKESDYFAGNTDKLISPIVHGLTGEITVNGETYNSVMPRQALNDREVTAVATYVLNNFGNKGGEVSLEDVQRVRANK